MRLPLNLHGEDGFSLPELLVTIVIVGITFVAILTGLMTTIKVSATHRTQATTDSVARSAAEWVKDIDKTPYSTTCNGPGMYSTFLMNFLGQLPPSESEYSATIERVEYWDGVAPSDTGTYDLSSHILPSCTGGDQGLQRITIVATSANGQASETVQVLKRAIP